MDETAHVIIRTMHPSPVPEEELQSSVKRLRVLATAISGVLWTTASDGSFVSENPSWGAYTGQSMAQSRGWGWVDAIQPDDRQDTLATWRRCVADRSNIECRYRLRRHDGEYREVLAQGGSLMTALTGWGGEKDRARTAEAGFDDHLTKPIEPAALQQYLARFSRVSATGIQSR